MASPGTLYEAEIDAERHLRGKVKISHFWKILESYDKKRNIMTFLQISGIGSMARPTNFFSVI